MKVLIIEDEPTIARILERKLLKKKFSVSKVDSISEAKDILKNEFDLVFLDFVLKDGRASDLLENEHLKAVPQIIMMSAFMEEIDKSVFSDFNIIKFLIKPFDDIDSVLNDI